MHICLRSSRDYMTADQLLLLVLSLEACLTGRRKPLGFFCLQKSVVLVSEWNSLSHFPLFPVRLPPT